VDSIFTYSRIQDANHFPLKNIKEKLIINYKAPKQTWTPDTIK
jgi:hypothetical protein